MTKSRSEQWRDRAREPGDPLGSRPGASERRAAQVEPTKLACEGWGAKAGDWEGSALLGRKSIALTLVATAASALAILLAPAAVPGTHLTGSATAAAPTVPWGFNENWGWANNVYAGPDLANRHMQIAGEVMPDSLSANRFSVMWEYVEDHQGTYDWSMSDAQYAAMKQYTPNPIMTLVRAPVWARDPAATCAFGPYDTCMYPQAPAYDAEWKKFVTAAVERYPEVRAIEVWNEPNLAIFWSPAADPVRYSAILQEAHDAVRAAGSAAPVITGGLFPVSTAIGNVRAMDFLDQVYTTAGAGAFEGIGSHPYPHTAPFVDTMQNRLDALRSVRNSHGDSGTPLWITEVGIPTDSSSGVSPDAQGDLLADLYRSVQESDVAAFIVHRFYDFDTDHYGVLNQDLTPKPAYCELGEQIGTLAPACPPSQSAPAPPAPTTPATATSPPPSGLRARALKKCKKKHGHARANCKKRANKLPF
jgi:hypothetical protein